MNYARNLLSQTAIPETVGLGAAAYVLKKLWDKGKLMLGYIHHASIDELGSWMGILERAEQNPEVTVNPGDMPS